MGTMYKREPPHEVMVVTDAIDRVFGKRRWSPFPFLLSGRRGYARLCAHAALDALRSISWDDVSGEDAGGGAGVREPRSPSPEQPRGGAGLNEPVPN